EQQSDPVTLDEPKILGPIEPRRFVVAGNGNHDALRSRSEPFRTSHEKTPSDDQMTTRTFAWHFVIRRDRSTQSPGCSVLSEATMGSRGAGERGGQRRGRRRTEARAVRPRMH